MKKYRLLYALYLIAIGMAVVLPLSANGQNEAPPEDTSGVEAVIETPEESSEEPEITADESEIDDDSLADIEALKSISSALKNKDKNGQTALHLAVKKNNSEIVSLLLNQGISVDEQDNEGQTALHIAAKQSYDKIASLLANKNADIYIKDNAGKTPADYAILSGAKLIKAIARKNNVNNGLVDGHTLLHEAASLGNPELTQGLIQLGADVNAVDKDGLLPVDYALGMKTSYDHALTTAYLIQGGSLYCQDKNYLYLFRAIRSGNVMVRYEYGVTALHYASENGHEGFVRYFLEKGAELEARDKPGNTPLHMAVRNGYINVVKLLLKAGAKINQKDYNSNTPLHECLGLPNSKDLLTLLISEGADVNAKNSYGNTPLHLSVQLGLSAETARQLIDSGSKLEYRNKAGNTPLYEAVEKSKIPLAELFLSYGAQIHAQNNRELSPALLAIRKGYETSEWFFSADNINTRNDEGNTALILAVESQAGRDVIEGLIKKGADLSARNYLGNTALHEAVKNNEIRTCQLLLMEKADIFLENNSGQSPLILAFEKGVDFTSAFFSENYLELTDTLGNTPLFHAVFWVRDDIVSLLLGKGAHTNVSNIYGSTPLHEAVKTGSELIVGILLENGADKEAQDDLGNYPLHEIVYWDSTSIGDILLSAGSPVDGQNLDGKTALHEAVISGDINIVQYLIKKGATLDTRDIFGKTPLFNAVEENNLEMVKLLINSGSSLTRRDDEGNTVLHVAIKAKNKGIASYLVQRDCDIFALNKQNEMPLTMAFEAGANVLNWFVTGKNVNDLDNQGNSPLHLAVLFEADENAVRVLLEKGAEKLARNSSGQTAYELAVEYGKTDTLPLLK